jgi:prepilin-type N-terminal cleavage/methylation domain-containing protein
MNHGFTLLELSVVLAILAAVAALVIPLVNDSDERSRDTAARASIQAVRDAFTGQFLQDMKYTPWYQSAPLSVRLHDLFSANRISPDSNTYSLDTRKGWRGPYLDVSRASQITAGDALIPQYAGANDLAPFDPWGRPMVIQYPLLPSLEESLHYARIVSAGPDGIIQTPHDPVMSSPSLARLAGRESNSSTQARGDDIVLFLNRADVYE